MIKQLNKKYGKPQCTFRRLHHFYYHFTSNHSESYSMPRGLFSFPLSSLKVVRCHFSNCLLTQRGWKPVLCHGNYREIFSWCYRFMKWDCVPSPLLHLPCPTMFLSVNWDLSHCPNMDNSFHLYWNGPCMYLPHPLLHQWLLIFLTCSLAFRRQVTFLMAWASHFLQFSQLPWFLCCICDYSSLFFTRYPLFFFWPQI